MNLPVYFTDLAREMAVKRSGRFNAGRGTEFIYCIH